MGSVGGEVGRQILKFVAEEPAQGNYIHKKYAAVSSVLNVPLKEQAS